MLPALAMSLLLLGQPKVTVSIEATAYQAVKLVEEDVAFLVTQGTNPQLVRYVWTPTGDVYDHAGTDFVVNTVISRATTQVPTTPVGGGRLVRVDFSLLARDQKDLEEMLSNWEIFAQDEPYFFAFHEEIVACEPYTHTDGKVYKSKRIRNQVQRHIPENSLPAVMGTLVPIVEYRWAWKRMLTNIENGVYYRFRGIPGTQAEYLQKFAGVSEKDVANLRSDQKYASFFSDVTAKPRATLVFRGIGGRSAVNQGLVMITQDISDDDNDPKKHPVLTLLDNEYSATEIITEMPNGFHTFGLFNGQGVRQDFAPDNVAKDHEIPRPYTAKLNGAISCIRCHATNDGIKPVVNDVITLIGDKKFRYFGEAKQGFPDRDTLDRAYALFSASLSKPLDRARDDYSDAVVLLGSRYRLPERLTVAKISEHISERYAQYAYKRIYAIDMLNDLGFRLDPADKDTAVLLLNKLIPDLPEDELGIKPEDPRIIALKRGLGINRVEAEQIYPDLATRLVLPEIDP